MSHNLEPCLKRRPKYWVACAKRSKITNARTKRHGDVSLEVGYQLHKSFVLMVLVVAVQKRRPRVIGDEINFHAAKPRHIDGVLHHSRRFLVSDFCHLECMSVQVDRM